MQKLEARGGRRVEIRKRAGGIEGACREGGRDGE